MDNTVTITIQSPLDFADQAAAIVGVTTLVDYRPRLQREITWLPYSGSQGLPAAPSLSAMSPVRANTSVGMAQSPRPIVQAGPTGLRQIRVGLSSLLNFADPG